MKRITCLILASLITYGWAQEPSHGSRTMPVNRPVAKPGPCDGLDERTSQALQTDSEKEVHRLFLSTVMYAARFEKEITQSPEVGEALKKPVTPPGDMRLSESSRALGIGSSILGGVAIWGAISYTGKFFNHDPVGMIGGGVVVLGSSILLSADSFGPGPREREYLEAGRKFTITAEQQAVLQKQMNASVGDLADTYARIFEWTPKGKQDFKAKLDAKVREALKNSEEGEIRKALSRIDPLEIAAEVDGTAAYRIKTMRELRALYLKAAAKNSNDLLSGQTLVRKADAAEVIHKNLASLETAKINLARLAKDLPPGSEAYMECVRLKSEFEAAEARLRELCQINQK